MHAAVTNALQHFQKTLEFLTKEFANLQIGRASPGIIEGIEVEAYGSAQPLRNLAQIAVTDARTLSVTSWDKTLLPAIEKAIRDANVGLSPVNNGNSIHLNFPPLTEERRKETVKSVHKLAEEAKITIRQQRQEAMDQIKRDDLSEDETKRAEKELQEKVDESNRRVEEMAKKKEEEVMKI